METISSPNYYLPSQSVPEYGRPRTLEVIVIHWWNAPEVHPTIEGTIQTFLNRSSGVSAHYVVNNTRTVRMVIEENIAWHALKANPFSIGIETDPNGGEAMYQRLGALVRDIRNRRGNLPLKPHNAYVNTACPGHTNLAKIDQLAKGELIMDSQDGTALFNTALFRAPESTATAGQWNGLKPATAMERLRQTNEWKGVRDRLAQFPKLATENTALKEQVAALESQPGTLAGASAEELIKELVRRGSQ